MSSFDRRTSILVFLSLAVAGCGFAPVHGRMARTPDLEGRVRVLPAPGRAGYFLISGLRNRLGAPNEDPEFLLSVDISTSSRVVVIGARDQSLRFEIKLVADYVLREAKSDRVAATNDVEVLTSVDATESAYAAYAAEKNRIQAAAEEAVDRILRDIYLHLALRES